MKVRLLNAYVAEVVASAEYERAVADSPEAEKLTEDISKAMLAYWQFLVEREVIEDGTEMLVAEANDMAVDITLKGGAIDRLYADAPTDDDGALKPAN
jgi:hypothetical protein